MLLAYLNSHEIVVANRGSILSPKNTYHFDLRVKVNRKSIQSQLSSFIFNGQFEQPFINISKGH